MDKLAFGFIPAGTGNGLHKAVVDSQGENHGIHSAAFAVAKGHTTKIDLTELELEYHQNEPNTKTYMFLAVFWAVISDIDINSEVIRWAGHPRLTIWGIYRTLSIRHYPGTLKYEGYHAKNKHEEIQNDQF